MPATQLDALEQDTGLLAAAARQLGETARRADWQSIPAQSDGLEQDLLVLNRELQLFVGTLPGSHR
jgi:hypothetical protein